jgi:hypothetical protein
VARDGLLRYERDGQPLAVVSIHRDVGSLKAELAIEGGGAGRYALFARRRTNFTSNAASQAPKTRPSKPIPARA